MSGGKSQEIVTYMSGQLRSIAGELRHGSDFLTELQQKAGTTQRGYAGNIKLFFEYFLNRAPIQDDVEEFWGLDEESANTLILKFKNYLVASGRKSATVNRYLAAIKFLIKAGRNLKRCSYRFDSDRIESLRVTKYRDTSGGEGG
ncbi:hypothetical protein CAL7102_00856 [Dulcicalothrix desertica PCC 7102]|nr:hypothetical protein CAL7102_00856 [Dulcicalothrix desertica PCC 7102]